ncbi:hypothetical protein EDD32_3590 [Georgenia muralis]|uniref:Dynamin family protein n=1 Tax=Georgenia muralis TaxID=154117 RepID=A0A3N4ZAS3_9MICO|nr:hypothetical protein EDD32_3590 [Georgenia muralis]
MNIGVSGEARVGKSTTLQKFSGLTDTQIPTGKGLPVTAVRSEIVNSADERAEVTFRDQKTFVAEYIHPLLEIVNGHLDVPLAVNTLAGLRTAKFPETLGSNVDSISTDSLNRLLDAQRSIDTYESLLTGGVRQVALDDLRSYVAYPSKEDLDAEKATGTPSSRSYIAVKSVKIFCHFPRLEGVKIGLVDLPGLGEIGASVADMHLRGLEDAVDQIFPIMRPTDAEGYAKQGIASNIDHLRRIQPGIKRRGDLITAGINVTEGLSATVETLRDDFERKINRASSDPIEVLEYTAIDDSSVADLFDTLLRRISDRLHTMDQEVLAHALASEASEADVRGTLTELSRTLTELLRLIPIPEKILLRQIDRIASDLIHEYNTFQKKLDDEADEHSDWYVAFDADVNRIHAESRASIEDGFFMGRAEWEFAARGRKDYYNWYRDEAQRIRREITAQYGGLDVFYDEQVTQFKDDLINIFLDNTGDLARKFQISPGDDPDVTIDKLAAEFGGTIQDDDLDSALALLKDVKFSFRNNVFLQIANHLKELANPRESFLLNPGANNPEWENIREVLGVVGNYDHQLGRLSDYLTCIATKANDSIRASLLQHDDRFHEYLSVSISFFNDFLYRKDEENFKHLVIRSLIKEYRDYILGENTGVSIDGKKKDLIDQIKASIEDVSDGSVEQPHRAVPPKRASPHTPAKPTKNESHPSDSSPVETVAVPPSDSSAGEVSDEPWMTPLPGSTNGVFTDGGWRP